MSDTSKFFTALLEVQKKIGPLKKDAKNPFFNSKYATLEQVLDCLKGPLFNAGLSVTQSTHEDNLLTVVAHISGESRSYTYPLACKDQNDPQKMGAAVSYARRYSLQGIFFMAAEDDDGNLASGKSSHGSHANQNSIVKGVNGPVDSPVGIDPGDYVFEFGKHKGKKVREILDGELDSWAEWVHQKAEKPLKPFMQKAFSAVEAYLEAKRQQEPDLPF